ncbi:CDP-diacylglycerol--serine O-phosphatidyltransferase [Geodermatophilus sabuli]|uniref:CDP-diacylglycerol--serine O-phosphatidyltransferase n=1 Tax=Geodermatophilus sabuli TaxID=1564158 RepID=A0A285EHI3_9ACTN|nr:CDP-diacylglycerol--serine O-phosphatidyltransferase [Geodermatophilus sabuli]MBB3085983.1 CDP-diacylglycerol--serine O-phosphatidyltransferase [Geodermatophilus sabuli]SNX98323.1 CDP-diacylglycerol--serine O-phosphatidyltransferase [Geodermatophilus sabuli]
MPSSASGQRPPQTRRTATVEFVRGSVRGTRRRALATLPSLFTLANMMCGFAAILVSIRGQYTLAAVLVGLSVVFDITDGAVARLVGAVTPFGLQFDSLADLVSFGLAPALLAFTLFSEGRDEWDPLGWVVCFLWVACAAIRLARFNTTIDPTADKRYFTGMPSPGAAGVVLASVFAFGDQMHGRDRLWVLLIVAVPALLMVSTVRFRSFRSLVSPKSGKPYGLIAAALAVVVGFALAPVVTGCVLAYGYLLAPVLVPLLSPLSRLVPTRLKELLT